VPSSGRQPKPNEPAQSSKPTRATGHAFITSPDVRESLEQLSLQQLIDEASERVARVAPGVTFEGVTHEEAASKVLIEASKGADLLVGGSRGLGGFTGLLLGSVSHQCSLLSHCLVVIVRPSD
jgi:nucleotide-binding universal stress UspA family protein